MGNSGDQKKIHLPGSWNWKTRLPSPTRWPENAGAASTQGECWLKEWNFEHIVDGQNPAPPRMMIIPIIYEVLTFPGGCLGFLPSTVLLMATRNPANRKPSWGREVGTWNLMKLLGFFFAPSQKGGWLVVWEFWTLNSIKNMTMEKKEPWMKMYKYLLLEKRLGDFPLPVMFVFWRIC